MVVLDVDSGELLALANFPTYNPNNRSKLAGRAAAQPRRHRHLRAGVDAQAVHRRARAGGRATEAGVGDPDRAGHAEHRRRDHPRRARRARRSRWRRSSRNPPTSARRRSRSAFPPRRCGRCSATSASARSPGWAFPARRPESSGPTAAGSPIEQATMSYGHGISVSLVQLARAYSVFARDGELVPSSLVRVDALPAGRRVMAPEDRLGGARDARDGGQPRRHRAARPDHGLPRRRQDGHRAQAGKRRLRRRQVRVLLRRLRARARTRAW